LNSDPQDTGKSLVKKKEEEENKMKQMLQEKSIL
jgi:hypothetical protein